MKNYNKILLALVALFFVTSCALEHPDASSTSESGMVTVNYTVTTPVTRAFGEGESINTIWYALYKTDGTLVTDFGTVSFNAGSAVCPVTMVRDQSYKIVFVGLHYDGQDPVYSIDAAAATIAMPDAAVANTDKYELFCAVQQVNNYDGGKTGSARLDRIVSQVSFVCTTEDWNAAETLGMKPVQSAVTLGGVPASYDIISGVASTSTCNVEYQRAALSGVANLLGAAYCFAGANVSATLKLYPSTSAAEPSTTLEVPVVPVEVNRRTNITGNIMTGTSNHNVGLETNGSSTGNEGQGSAYDVWAGGTQEVITDPAVPAVYPVSNGRHLAWISEQLVADIDNFVGKTIRLDSDIYLGAQWKTLDAYAAAGKITFDGNGKTIYGLTAPLFGKYIGDVRDLTISNADIKSSDAGIATFCTSLEGDLTNVTVKNSTLTAVNPTAQTKNWGGLVGIYDDGNATACKAENVTITGFDQEAGCLFGAIKTTKDREFRNCSAVNCKIDPTRPIIGAIVGYIYPAGIKFYGCSQTGCTPTNLVGGGDYMHDGEMI